MTTLVERPDAAEHEAYYSTYIDQVPEGDVLEILSTQIETPLGLLASVSPELEEHRYAPDKWTVREVVGHVIDAERVFAHRAFSFARADAAPLPGMDQNEYATVSNAAVRPLAELTAELAAVRKATLALFRGFPQRRGRDPAWRAASPSASARFHSSLPVTRSIIEQAS